MLVISADHQSGIMQHGVNSAFAYFSIARIIHWERWEYAGNSLSRSRNNSVGAFWVSRRFMTANPHMISRCSDLAKKDGGPLKGPWKMWENLPWKRWTWMGCCQNVGLVGTVQYVRGEKRQVISGLGTEVFPFSFLGDQRVRLTNYGQANH